MLQNENRETSSSAITLANHISMAGEPRWGIAKTDKRVEKLTSRLEAKYVLAPQSMMLCGEKKANCQPSLQHVQELTEIANTIGGISGLTLISQSWCFGRTRQWERPELSSCNDKIYSYKPLFSALLLLHPSFILTSVASVYRYKPEYLTSLLCLLATVVLIWTSELRETRTKRWLRVSHKPPPPLP